MKTSQYVQAVVRGHLVRNHVVGTLRCVQAIVKMQALVRARRADMASELHSDPKYISIEKLLSNSLARQLLEPAPKNKQINIKCVPSKSDSAWNWLERWMSVSSPETMESRTPEQNQEKVISVIRDCESMELESSVGEETVFSDEKFDLVKVNTEEKSDEEEIPQPESMDLIVEESVLEIEPKRVTNRLATDEADSEGRKSVFGSRKPISPSFIAAQSRFEELTSKNNIPSKPSDSSKQENDDFTPEHITPSILLLIKTMTLIPLNTSPHQNPWSSPDVQDKEIYLKKRHSLPGNGRQASPRIQRSILL
ncbi:unnamed protein product [Lactuca virosa]|uniref:DUF4005 domain-containing protein n=1 Tax=Lactuca virosa TaxID=75947 RepID=A0AAU9PB07_9ASTR|nr:unnamed protein product [Lactuca virosa]